MANGPIGFTAPAGAHLSYFGGPVISNVHIVQVLYGSGSYNAQVAGTSTPSMGNFYSDITGSGFINLLSQYSTPASGGTNQTIGNGTFDGLFQIVPSAGNNGSTISDAQIQSELLAQITAGHLPAPVLDAAGNVNTLYMIFFPPGKTITLGGSTSCVAGGFCAYHSTTSTTLNAKNLLYGVHPDMQAGSGCATGCGSSSVFGNYTSVTSHELAEAITDADVGIATSVAFPVAWYDPTNNLGEIGDICNGQQGSYLANVTTYTIQLEFSNSANDCILPPATHIPPLVTYTLSSNNAEVVYIGNNLHVLQLVWLGSGLNWVLHDLTAAAGGPLAAAQSTLTRFSLGSTNAEVVYLDANQHVNQLAWNGTSWVNQDLTSLTGGPQAAAGSALSAYTLNSTNAEVVYLGTNQHVLQLAWNGSSWVSQDLTSFTGAPVAAAGSALSTFMLNSNNANVIYLGTNQHVYQLAWPGPGFNWVSVDLTANAGSNTPLAAAGSALSTFSLNSSNANVIYLGTNQHVYQLAWPGSGSSWVSVDLTANAGSNTPLAAAGSALSTYMLNSSNANVIYLGTNQHVYQLAWPGPGFSWISQDLTAFAGSNTPLALGGSAVSSYTLGSSNAEVVYTGPGLHVEQLAWNGTSWVSQDLTVAAGGP